MAKAKISESEQERAEEVLSIEEELARARAESEVARKILTELEDHFARAVRDEEFSTAEILKARLPDARTVFALAEARARALESIAAEMAAEEARRTAEANRARLVEAAEMNLAEARERERRATADSARLLAEVREGLDDLRARLVHALACDDLATQAREDVMRAEEVMTGQHYRVSRVTTVQSMIDRDPVLAELMRRTP